MQARYFYGDAEQNEHGPYSAAQIRAMAMAGQLTLDTPLYVSGSAAWATLADFPELTGSEVAAPAAVVDAPMAMVEPGVSRSGVPMVFFVIAVLLALAALLSGSLFLGVLALLCMVVCALCARGHRCGRCQQTLPHDRAEVCPHCSARLVRMQPSPEQPRATSSWVVVAGIVVLVGGAFAAALLLR